MRSWGVIGGIRGDRWEKRDRGGNRGKKGVRDMSIWEELVKSFYRVRRHIEARTMANPLKVGHPLFSQEMVSSSY